MMLIPRIVKKIRTYTHLKVCIYMRMKYQYNNQDIYVNLSIGIQTNLKSFWYPFFDSYIPLSGNTLRKIEIDVDSKDYVQGHYFL